MPIATEIPVSVQLPPSGQILSSSSPVSPGTPKRNHKTFILIIVMILVLLAVVAIAVVTLGSGGSQVQVPAGTPGASGVPGSSIAPGAALTFASQKYNYSIRLPAGWTRLEANEYKKTLLDLENPGLDEAQKQSLLDYFLQADMIYWDDKSTSSFKPKFLVSVKGGGTIDGEVAELKSLAGRVYLQPEFLEDKQVSFQNQTAYSVVVRGTVGQNALYSRQMVFEQNGKIFTLGILILEDDRKNNFDLLFSGVANSFSLLAP